MSEWLNNKTVVITIATNDVDIYITNIGTTEINTFMPVFMFQAFDECEANIYLSSENGFDNFIITSQTSDLPILFETMEAGVINVYMNNVQIDVNGNFID